MNGELSEIIDEADRISRRVSASFGTLNKDQLNWRSDQSTWSIAQCLEHLVITNTLEFPELRRAADPANRNPGWSRIPFLPKFFGGMMIRMFATDSPRRMKAPIAFRPSQSEITETIVADFLTHQDEVIGLIRQFVEIDVHRTKIVSPVSNFVTYSLFDACRILVGHEKRHLRQAERILQHGDFPK